MIFVLNIFDWRILNGNSQSLTCVVFTASEHYVLARKSAADL